MLHHRRSEWLAGRALALPIIPPERDIAARVTIELFAEHSLAHVIYVCAQPIIFSLLRPYGKRLSLLYHVLHMVNV